MAIKVSCPSCERELKVKDELAGRKIKCPGCAEPITVPKPGGGEKAKAAKEPRKPSPEEDAETEDADEEERRPKKKKKKPAKSNTLLIVGIACGGATLVLIGVVVVLVVMFGGSSPTKDGVAKGGTQKAIEPGKQGRRAQGPGRALDATTASNRLKQIGLAYHNCFDSGKKVGPANQVEMSKFYNNDPEINELLSSKRITVIWSIPKDSFKADIDQLIAYESEPDSAGIRIVLHALGNTEEMDEAEFQAARKAKK